MNASTANPYLPPQTNPVAVAERNQFKDIATPDLKKLRNDSSTIRTFAVLVLIGATLMLVGSIAVLVGSDMATTGMTELAIMGILLPWYALTGVGLIRRQVWGRYLGFMTAAFSLLGFPIGTLIGVLVLISLSRSARLFGPDRLNHKALNTEWKYRKTNKVP